MGLVEVDVERCKGSGDGDGCGGERVVFLTEMEREGGSIRIVGSTSSWTLLSARCMERRAGGRLGLEGWSGDR